MEIGPWDSNVETLSIILPHRETEKGEYSKINFTEDHVCPPHTCKGACSWRGHSVNKAGGTCSVSRTLSLKTFWQVSFLLVQGLSKHSSYDPTVLSLRRDWSLTPSWQSSFSGTNPEVFNVTMSGGKEARSISSLDLFSLHSLVCAAELIKGKSGQYVGSSRSVPDFPSSLPFLC